MPLIFVTKATFEVNKKLNDMNKCPKCDENLKTFNLSINNRDIKGLFCEKCNEIIYIDDTQIIADKLKTFIESVQLNTLDAINRIIAEMKK